MPRANASANKATVKKADTVMENQLEIPDFKFGQPVKEQPEVNVQVVFEKGGIDSEEKGTLFILYIFGFMVTLLNFVILAKQVW